MYMYSYMYMLVIDYWLLDSASLSNPVSLANTRFFLTILVHSSEVTLLALSSLLCLVEHFICYLIPSQLPLNNFGLSSVQLWVNLKKSSEWKVFLMEWEELLIYPW